MNSVSSISTIHKPKRFITIKMASSPLLLTLLCSLLSIYTALAGTNAEGLAFLEAKGKEEGVVTRPSGLMYKELRPGNRA